MNKQTLDILGKKTRHYIISKEANSLAVVCHGLLILNLNATMNNGPLIKHVRTYLAVLMKYHSNIKAAVDSSPVILQHY